MATVGLRLSHAVEGMRQSVFASLRGRIDALRARGGSLIPLHIGDTCLPPPVSEHQLEAAEIARLGSYGAPAGVDALRQALADFRATEVDRIHVGCGATHALFCAARALLDPGDDVLVVSPFWPLIVGVLRTAGANPIEVPLSWDLYADPGLDIGARLSDALTPRTRALYLITPNNPDGQMYSRSQLEVFADFAKAHGLWVIADEVYADFAYAEDHVSIAGLAGMAERTVTSHSLSKSHALAGARIGYVIAPPEVIDAARRISNHTLYNVPESMQRLATAAVISGTPWIEAARKHYREARTRAGEALAPLAERGVVVHAPKGGSFYFLDFAPALASPAADAQRLLEQGIDHGVLLAPGSAFGRDFASCMRLCFTGVPSAEVEVGIARLTEALASL